MTLVEIVVIDERGALWDPWEYRLRAVCPHCGLRALQDDRCTACGGSKSPPRLIATEKGPTP